jgi:hypothetical protein
MVAVVSGSIKNKVKPPFVTVSNAAGTKANNKITNEI